MSLNRWRITPAYAGKSYGGGVSPAHGRDHPRVCGEKWRKQGAEAGAVGSPPRMRGKAGWRKCPAPWLGITPAYAGKRERGCCEAAARGDHPRVCGEKVSLLPEGAETEGSPPRMRGKDSGRQGTEDAPGITPAYAGKSPRPSRRKPPRKDHPRVCGEKRFFKVLLHPAPGSPPRMRGKAQITEHFAGVVGITPAYAGKSSTSSWSAASNRDHPRVCGEKVNGKPTYSRDEGSPPRMRGKEPSRHRRRAGPGITPAYAGKRLKRSHSIGHFSCILCLFHSVLHRASVSDGSRAGPCAPPCLPAQNAVPV